MNICLKDGSPLRTLNRSYGFDIRYQFFSRFFSVTHTNFIIYTFNQPFVLREDAPLGRLLEVFIV